MECPICYNNISHSCVGSCLHHFCYVCLLKWCNQKRLQNETKTCPICRKPIFEIKFDYEFDVICNGIPSQAFKFPNEMKIQFPPKTHAGVTLKNNPNGLGVVIFSVNRHDQIYKSGLRKGHVILVINNILCNNHNYAIDIINYCQDTNSTLTLNTLTKIN